MTNQCSTRDFASVHTEMSVSNICTDVIYAEDEMGFSF